MTPQARSDPKDLYICPLSDPEDLYICPGDIKNMTSWARHGP